jgi:hypothetical protein
VTRFLRHGSSAARRRAPGRRIARLLLATLLIVAPAPGADLFYMDHDPLSKEYVGPVGPLVLSGDITPGDYDQLLARIAADANRFIAQNKLIVGSDGGDLPETLRIANLVKSLDTEVLVGPLTGRCIGACFLIYAAAAQRGTDGPHLVGIHRANPEPGSEAQVRGFLAENEIPGYLVDELFAHTENDVYWLSESDEKNLGAMSPAFERLMAAKCGWNADLERAVYKGERPMDDLKSVWACRSRLTESAARQDLAAALKEKATPDATGKEAIVPVCRKKGAPAKDGAKCSPGKSASGTAPTPSTAP